MVNTATETRHTSRETPLAEQRVIFHNISWQAYEQILEALGDQR